MCRRPAGDSVAGGSEAAARAPAEQLHRVGGREHLRPARARAGQASQTRRGAPTPPRPSLYEVRIPYNRTLRAAANGARRLHRNRRSYGEPRHLVHSASVAHNSVEFTGYIRSNVPILTRTA